MRRPDSWLALWALLLSLIGGGLFLFGLVHMVFSLPMRSGSSWALLLTGAAFLIVGGACALLARRRSRQHKRLREYGTTAPGRVVQIKYHGFVTWNEPSGSRSPWSVRCEYTYEGRTYTVKSGFFWEKPSQYDQHPVVYLDPARPQRAFLDPDSIRQMF